MGPEASVIISTYERAGHLARCLEGFRRQSDLRFDVLVADDGSGPETRELVERVAKDYPVPLRHVWQENAGFRKCRVLNLASRAAAADYLIYTDGDCVPHPRYVEMHLRYRAPGRYLVGRSVKWGEARSRRVDVAAVARGEHARIGLGDWWDSLRQRNRNLPYGVFLPGDASFRLMQRLKKNRNLRGGNCSLWRADLERVNGWNEDFESWGLEDVELGYRLRLAGVEPALVINRACTFHMHHPEGDKKSRSARTAYNATKARGVPWCPNGLVRAEAPPAA